MPPPKTRRLREHLESHSSTSTSGTNSLLLIEKIIRERIWQSSFWKEHCFGMNVATLATKAAERISYVGGTYGGARRPSPFLCLAMKMLDENPPLEVVFEYVRQGDFKYARALGAFYIRLTCRPIQIYGTLEPLLADRRKLRMRKMDGTFAISHVDEFVDSLLTENRVCDTILPHLPSREIVDESGVLGPRRSQIRPVFDSLLSSGLVTEDGILLRDSASAEGGDNDGGDAQQTKKKRKKGLSWLKPASSSSSEGPAKGNDGAAGVGGARKTDGPQGNAAGGRADTSSSRRDIFVGGEGAVLTIAETNALRARLGLKPLKL